MPTNSIRTGVDSRLLYSTAMQRAFGAGDLCGMHCDAFVQNEGKKQKQKKLNEKKKKKHFINKIVFTIFLEHIRCHVRSFVVANVIYCSRNQKEIYICKMHMCGCMRFYSRITGTLIRFRISLNLTLPSPPPLSSPIHIRSVSLRRAYRSYVRRWCCWFDTMWYTFSYVFVFMSMALIECASTCVYVQTSSECLCTHARR